MKKRFLIFFVFILFSFAIFACSCERPPIKGGYEHPVFKTKYTVEEHIQRITARTEERFQKDIENGFIVDIFVDIVYAFYDDDPEYFLVEIEYKEKIPYDKITGNINRPPFPYELGFDENGACWTYPDKITHFIGFIQDDRYRTGLIYGADFQLFSSPYTICGYRDAKKYYGAYKLGVAKEEGVFLFWSDGKMIDEYIVSKEEAKGLMEGNFKLFPRAY